MYPPFVGRKQHQNAKVTNNHNKLQKNIFEWKKALPYYIHVAYILTIHSKSLDFSCYSHLIDALKSY
jgi:hypothetical protein